MGAFSSSVQGSVSGIDAGEVISTKPNNVEAYELFESGIVTVGRFVKFDTGSIDALDASATPKIAGVIRRKTNRVSGETTYKNTIDQVVEVVDFGHVTVDVNAGSVPTKFAPVYTINAAGANSGKATEVASGNLLVTNAVFWEQVKPDVWVVRLQYYC